MCGSKKFRASRNSGVLTTLFLHFIVSLVLLAIGLFSPAHAQQPNNVPRIGFVDAGSPATTGHRAQAFVLGLRDLGYVEGD